jgi:HAD superfamily hydrolase (TIGR01484 family)
MDALSTRKVAAMTVQPFANMPMDAVRAIRIVLTDIDDTLTLHGKLPAQAYDAIQKLKAIGIAVVPITGRPAGWCDHIARMWPVDAVVGENGAFYFRYDEKRKTMQRVYAQSKDTREVNQGKLWDIASRILAAFPGSAIASDQAYREIDIAIDFCEDVPPLPLSVAQEIARQFEAEGAIAKVSSIHVNAWFGDHDKLSMSNQMLSDIFGLLPEHARTTVAYVGDSPNDSPMFGHFPMSIAVANAKPMLHLMPHKPAYLTKGEGGMGFTEFASVIFAAMSD